MAGNSDFFLNFGSNAKTWASGLSGELKPATESITSLTTALERYDQATNNRKSNGPLDSLFTRLDAVSEKFSDLTGSLASTFDTAIRSIGLLQKDIAGLLSSVQAVTRESGKTKTGPGRRPIDAVSDADVEGAAVLRNRQALRVNTTAANKQLDRLAEINGRLAPRAQEAADKIINLSASIGELQGASHRAMGGLDALEAKLSRLGEGVVINAPAGVAGSGISVNPNDFGPMIEQLASAIRGMTLTFDHATIQNGRIVQQAQQVVDSAPISRVEQRQDAGKVGIFGAGDVVSTTYGQLPTNQSARDNFIRDNAAGPGQYPTRMIPTFLKNGRPGKPRELEILDETRLNQPARSAWPEGSRGGSRTFALGTRPVTFKQGDLVGNETFEQMFARMEELDKRFRPVEDKLPTATQIDPQNGAILEKVSKAFWQGGGAHQRFVTRNADRMSGQHALSESISAHPTTSIFSTGSIDGIRVGSLLKRAEEAGLGMVSRKDPESGEMRQEFDQAELTKQALALTSQQFIPGKFGVQEGILPAARSEVLKQFLRDELIKNQHQTFSGLGSSELDRTRKVYDEGLVAHHEGLQTLPPDVRNLRFKTYDPALLEHFAPESDAYNQLIEGARNRLAADKETGEVGSNIRAVQSARRSYQQRRAVNEEARSFKEDTGLGILPDRGTGPAYEDATITAARLNQQSALATQISQAKERRDQTQAFLEKETLRRASLGRELQQKDPAKYTENYNKATQNINQAMSGVETTSAHIKDLEEQLSAMRKAHAAQRSAARESIKRYQEISKTANEAREELQGILKTQNFPGKTYNLKGEIASTDAPKQLTDSDAYSHLGMMDRFGNIKGTTTVPVKEPEGRLEALQKQLELSKTLLERAQNDPKGFAAAAVDQSSTTKAVTRASLLPGIQERLHAAEAELAPGVQEEQRLKDAALKARAAQEDRARARGASEKDIQEAVRRRNAQRREDPQGFSPENLAAENRYRAFANQRQEAEAARQAQLEDLRQKATAAREKKDKNLSLDERNAGARQRNLERLIGGGYSPGDLPAERAAIKARLSTPEGRLEQAQRELRQLDKVSAASASGVLREARMATPESVYAVENAAGKLFLPSGDKGESPIDRVKRTLKREIEGLEESITGFGQRQVLPKLNDEQRQEALRNAAQSRASTFLPLLQKYNVPDAEAVAMGPTHLMEAALVEAASKLDAAAVDQQKAADKAEAAQDRKDGFKKTPAQERAAGRGGNEGVRFAPRLDEDGNVIEGDLTPRQQRRRAKTQRESSESVAYSDIVPGTERGPLGERLGAIDLTKMVAKLESAIGSKRTPEGRKEVLQEQLERASAALKNLTKAADEAAAAEGKVAATGNSLAERSLRAQQNANSKQSGWDGLNKDSRKSLAEEERQSPNSITWEELGRPPVPGYDQERLGLSDLRRQQKTLQKGVAEGGNLFKGKESYAEDLTRVEAAISRLTESTASGVNEHLSANIAGEAADAKAPAVPAALLAEKELLDSQHAESLASKRAANSALKKANAEGTATDELRATSEASNAAHKELNQRIARLSTQIAKEEAAVARATEAAGGGGGKPPRPPKSTGGGGTADEPSDGEKKPRPRSAAEASNDKFNTAQHLANFAQFSPDVQAAVQTAARAAGVKPGVTLTDAQKKAILPSLFQFRDDPMYGKYDAKTARRTFAAGAGITLPGDVGNQRFLTDSFNLNKSGPGSSSAIQGVRDLTRVEEALAIESVKVREALLAQIAAEERLAAVRANPNSTAGQIARAERSVSVASRQYEAAKLEAANPPIGGIGKLLQSGGQQAIRFATFQIAFTGIEKVRELVDTGIQAQTQFIRLQQNLEATGRSANGLMQALGDVSSQTAQPLAHTIQAASELTGVLKTKGDLIEGAKIASELANISHGMLTATQAAIGLRDVTDAYGLSGVTALRGVGDMITKVSQVTGVSVHDVIEGTTQLAQEAHSFGIGPRQAAVLAAEVTKNTGESGEAAAEQVSRILSTFNNGKVQQLLARTVVPTLDQDGNKNKDAGKTVVPQELFNQKGGIGQGLTQLLSMYDQLAPAQQHAIDALVGTGRQARALTGLLRDAATAGKLLTDVQDDQGALAKQNAAFLSTLGGAVQKLGADFRNLGADLMQAHVFDILMVIVGAVDKLMTTVDSLFRVFDKFNDNPLTKNLLQMIVLLGEVSLAFKVFGGEKAAAFGMRMAGGIGLGGFFTNVGAAREQQTRAAGGSFVPFARTRAMGTAFGDVFMGTRGRAGRGGLFTPSAATLFNSPIYNPSGQIYASEEEAASLSARQRFRAAARARAGSGIASTEQALGNALTGQAAGVQAAGGTATVASQVSVAARTAATNLGNLTKSMYSMASGVAGPIAAFVLLEEVMNIWSKTTAYNAETQKRVARLDDYLMPKDDPNHGAKTDGQQSKSEAQGVIDRVTGRGRHSKSHWYNPGIVQHFNGGHPVTWGDMWQEDRDFISGNNSHGNTSKKFDKEYDALLKRSQTNLQKAIATGDPDKIADAQAVMDKDIAAAAKKAKKDAGDKDAQAVAAAELTQLKTMFDDAASSRAKNLAGIASFDQLTLQELENMQTFVSKTSSMNTRTMRADPKGLRDAFDDTGVDPKTKIGQLGLKIISGEGALARAQDTAAADKLQLPQLDIDIHAAGLGTPDYDRLTKARDAVMSNLQQQMDLIDQLTIQNHDAFANILTKIGNLPGAGGQLDAETTALKAAMISIGDPTDPTYLADLGSLADKNQQKADLAVQGRVDAATLDSARNPNKVSQARDAQTIAQLKLDAARAAASTTSSDLVALQQGDKTALTAARSNLSSFYSSRDNEGNAQIAQVNSQHEADLTAKVAQAEANVAATSALVGVDSTEKAAAVQAALASKAQADQAVTQSLQDQRDSAFSLQAAYLQSSGAGTLAIDAKNVEKANSDVAFAIKTYKAGSTEANNAQIAALQAGITQKQDTHDQDTSAMSLRAAIQTNAGDTTGAARTNLSKANSDLAFAVAAYGKDSKQANDARAAAIAANANLQKEIDDALNAALDLEISMLSNRGNDSDKRQILTDKVKQAQNNLNAFTAKGGKLASPEGQRLQANVNDARRSRIDQGAQIEIDTLEFQHATFKISASQEIAALQNILKTKQLTQDRARSIMLQIKGLQGEMQGQFNLGDIKLPSVYDVRRVMASGRAGAVAAASSIGYQDNRTINIQINGGHLDKVKAAMTDVLGTTATSRVTVAPKKGV